jgi:hypothetical protein
MSVFLGSLDLKGRANDDDQPMTAPALGEVEHISQALQK